jgi:two-component system, LytTR family, response regulator
MVIEDNPHSLSELLSLLSQFDSVDVIGNASDGNQAVELITRLKPDCLFLDVNLPGLNGFEILKRIPFEPMVIFVTAFDNHAVKAFEANGIDYLLKPVTMERLKKAVDKATRFFQPTPPNIVQIVNDILTEKKHETRFAVKTKEQILIIPQEEVFFFNAENKYVFLNTDECSYFYNATLKDLVSKLNPGMFQRINKSHIVSLAKIKKLRKTLKREYMVILSDNNSTSIKVSRNYLSALKKGLSL